jgi:hypothetical protein
MIHIIYIYFIINSFIAGNYLFDGFNDDSSLRKLGIFSVLFLFGAPWILLYLVSELPRFRWIKNEFWFIYHFYITNYWKNAVENNQERDKEGVLEMLNNFAEKSNKQSKRHNRQIQKRYGNNSLQSI